MVKNLSLPVIPAPACGRQGSRNPGVVPANAGNQKYMKLNSCFHRKPWIPAGVYPVLDTGRE